MNFKEIDKDGYPIKIEENTENENVNNRINGKFDEQIYSSYSFEEAILIRKNKGTCNSGKLGKMQQWSMYTNKEKIDYKNANYIKELCEKLNVHHNFIEQIIDFVLKITEAIKETNDGPKRARVKDGIIIMCIYYITKDTNNTNGNYIDMAKKINLDIKFITKADKLLLELINCNKLKFDKEFMNKILYTETPINYVNKIIDKYSNFKQFPGLIDNVSHLINICEEYDILLDHTPIAIGSSCLYFILNNIFEQDLNIKIFAEMYNLSIVTIIKTIKKLEKHKEQINFVIDFTSIN
jgi:transcription initiation factor TFIIIB Brf1 subunit/transcription initiation factor TFIIB